MCRIKWHVGPAPANRRSECAGEWRPKVQHKRVSVSPFSRKSPPVHHRGGSALMSHGGQFF
jgi:hypothetical protein